MPKHRYYYKCTMVDREGGYWWAVYDRQAGEDWSITTEFSRRAAQEVVRELNEKAKKATK